MLFHNVEEFIAEMAGTKLFIEQVRAKALREGNGYFLAQADMLLALFANDCAILRKTYAKMVGPDGTLELVEPYLKLD